MFRIRAVESPPDAHGVKKVWHRGVRGAELVSEVDQSGRVTRHELTLFEDVLTWEKSSGLTTSAVVTGEGERPAATDVAPDAGASKERIKRAAIALEGYRGQDRFIQHIRDVVLAESGDVSPRLIGAQVTSPGTPAITDAAPPPVAAPPQRMDLGLVMIGMGFLIVVTAIFLLLAR